MTSDNGNPIPDGAEPYLRGIVREEMQAFLEQRLTPQLTKFSEEIAKTMPTPASVIEATATMLYQRLETEKQKRIEEARKELAGPGPTEQSTLVTALKTDPVGTIATVADQFLSVVLKALDVWDRRNPAGQFMRLARVMQEQDPMMAQFVGQYLSPDPMERFVPGLLSDAMAKGMDAGYKATYRGLVGAGWRPPVHRNGTGSLPSDEVNDTSSGVTKNSPVKSKLRELTSHTKR